MKKKFIDWSWIFLVIFFVLSIIDFRFGVAAVICMVTPIYFAIIGEGRKGCNSYCPRGSFLSKLKYISLRKSAPKWILSEKFKVMVLTFMFSAFGIGLYFSGGDLLKIGLVFLRLVAISTIFSFILGILYKERTWCAICPMGNIAGKISSKKK